ncbi:MAG: D-hexose-6-phosphate mutarotase [Propionibacterium sp.]|nr:D-hexose-6-phosphate mutarotase [Propionibacterium sp.]
MTDIELPEGITLLDAPLAGIKVDTPAATGVIYFNGAHIAAWTPAGQHPVLWLSDQAILEPGKAIRGGIPLLWPWFGAGDDGQHTPMHGIARVSTWNLLRAKVSPAGTANIVLGLDGAAVDPGLAPDLPRDYRLELHISMGKTLIVQLVVFAGDSELFFEDGLHSYFAVGDIHKTRIEGLDGAAYSDRLTDGCATQQGAVSFEGETDRIYESRETLRIIDDEWNRTLLIEKVGSAQSVIWNPWIAKAAATPDLGNDDWQEFVCAEAVNVRDQSVNVEPDGRHLISQTISII